ncbi:hypothetical protein M422DRAFT_30099 [Sphaerobolus stellatus SS14]|uniref:Uncharacterized protein n=1 Tax=Sphaerobolus stellatus (strain SS14) TaxID=990650 RepID=A0A0C9UQM5_SPHS4|nr:hypothetical protein M422DRAFT_30099 [Sphaerobolus stellatus SS14]
MQPRPSGSKSRPTARKRVNADDSPFIGPSGGNKRGADKADGGLERAKRKRVDAQSGSSSKRTDRNADGESSSLTVDFHAFPLEALHKYLLQVDAVPQLNPSPCSTETPPLPSSLLNPPVVAPRIASPVPSSTPANRPKRDGRESQRRRSSRLQEEDARSRKAPILADAEAVQDVFATLAERNFEKTTIREVDALHQFILAVKTRC